MSFILDALKKSENERQRQVGPSLADVPVSRRRNEKPWWVVAVATLLVVNLGVLLIVLMRSGDAKPAATEPAAKNPPPATTNAPEPQIQTQQYAGTPIPVTTHEAPTPRSNQPAAAPVNPSVRSLADEAGGYGTTESGAVPNPHLAAAATVPEGPPMVRPIDAPAVTPLPARTALESRAARDDEVLPTVTDITAGGTTLPDMHIDIHVNSANAAERFVFVNMRKYTEGQTLNEGPMVERITADGVILNHQGLRFLLPRQ